VSAQELSFDFGVALRRLVELRGSDLHLKVGNRPLVRVNGSLQWLDATGPRLEPWETERLLREILPQTRAEEFERSREVDFAYAAPGVGRFRVNAYRQRGSVSIAMRLIRSSPLSLRDLGLPDVIRRLAEEDRGIVLLTGTTGSGKSTTLAAMIEHINRTSWKHIVTVEDPIEYIHRDDKAAIEQREVGVDTDSFGTALRRVLRQDPDVILIGEIRDEETMRTALAAAETGHLVLSTLHTLDAPETVTRIVDFFEPYEHGHVRTMLAGTLKGIVSQRLVPRTGGQGLVPVCEILTMTGRVHDMILDPARAGALQEVMAEGEYYGMRTFDQALYAAVHGGAVEPRVALSHANNPHDFKLLVQSGGVRSTSMQDVGRAATAAAAAEAEVTRRDDEPGAPSPSPGSA
jgi:twitching motility protein PilT